MKVTLAVLAAGLLLAGLETAHAQGTCAQIEQGRDTRGGGWGAYVTNACAFAIEVQIRWVGPAAADHATVTPGRRRYFSNPKAQGVRNVYVCNHDQWRENTCRFPAP
jgi:hypothetical protein